MDTDRESLLRRLYGESLDLIATHKREGDVSSAVFESALAVFVTFLVVAGASAIACGIYLSAVAFPFAVVGIAAGVLVFAGSVWLMYAMANGEGKAPTDTEVRGRGRSEAESGW